MTGIKILVNSQAVKRSSSSSGQGSRYVHGPRMRYAARYLWTGFEAELGVAKS